MSSEFERENNIILNGMVKEFSENVQLKVLDDIFQQFLHAIRRDGFDPLKLHLEKDFPIYSVYTHLEIPYLCTCLKGTYCGRIYLDIKLNNNGFMYPKLPYKKDDIKRHNSSSWSMVNYTDCFMNLALRNMKRFFSQMLGPDFELHFYYNEKEQRADIKAIKTSLIKDRSDLGIITVTFECGYPYVDYNEEKNILYQSNNKNFIQNGFC